jgi:DNA-binding response OmpR family regulator
MKILLLEDDYNLAEVIKEVLEIEGFDVDLVHTADETYEKTFNNQYDLYIFDINLGQDNGIEVLQNLRDADDTTPAIYITALTDLDTISKAFSVGADDYIKKPFEVEELLIRIKAKMDKSIKIGDYEYNLSNKQLTQNGKIISLGATLSDIFHTLVVNKNKIVPKDKLLEFTNDATLRVHLSKLKKLGFNIQNIRSQGYILEV